MSSRTNLGSGKHCAQLQLNVLCNAMASTHAPSRRLLKLGVQAWGSKRSVYLIGSYKGLDVLRVMHSRAEAPDRTITDLEQSIANLPVCDG